MKLKELFELARIEGADMAGSAETEIGGLALKAADVQSGYAFVALRGSQKDGADFIPEAITQGAVVVLAERAVVADVPVIVVPELRRAVSRMAAVLYPSAGLKKVAVTGTNGKTSTVFYVQQILNKLGICAASLGTIGVESPVWREDGSVTTPDAVTLNRTLHTLAEKGVQVVAMETSSHGLDQGRTDGLTFAAGAFTNLTRDHLDYHGTMAAYLAAKSRLFSEVVSVGGVAVLNADVPEFGTLKDVAEERGQRVIAYGRNGGDFRLIAQEPTAAGQRVVVDMMGQRYETEVAIVGDFQVMNLLAATGLCVAVGADLSQVMALWSSLQAPSGRIELMGTLPNGAQVFVDYAHTPDAIERVLVSLRPHTTGKLVCLFGCGGNRDTGKRAQMGALADRLADVVYIADDNPRFEEPAAIRAEIKAACPKGIVCENREEAIHQAIAALQAGDVLVLAGKGHEAGQTIQGVTYAFDDRVEARLAIQKAEKTALWPAADLRLALSAKVADIVAGYGVSIDTRTIGLGDIFVALRGEKSDGHDFVYQAVAKGAAACIVDHLVDRVPAAKQIVVGDTTAALESMARFARMRSEALFVGVTGSSGKTTTKEMLRRCLADQGETYATAGNFNNQIGVPLTLARLPINTQYAVIEMGMNHPGELMQLSDMVRPDVTIVTMIGSAHRAFFADDREIAAAKAEIFDYQNRQGTAVINRDSAFYGFLADAATMQGIKKITSFGQDAKADIILTSALPEGEGMRVNARWHGEDLSFRIGFLGQHFAMNALAVLGAVDALGASVEQAMRSLADTAPVAGRGACLNVTLSDGRRIRVIDDAYNANPSSMAASIMSLGLRQGGRKIAVLGDMLELGAAGAAMHVGLSGALAAAGVDKVYTVGSLMHALFDALPFDRQGAAAASAAEIVPVLIRDLQDGDVVLIKASNGTGLSVVLSALKGA